MLALVNTPSGERPVEMREVPEPALAPDEALVEVRAFSLNRGDFYLLARRPEGWIPGNDVSGVVGRAASDGSGPPKGSRVVGFVGDGGWARRVAVPTEHLAALAGGVGFSEAAALPVAGLTALRALRLGGLLLGRRVLVTGASGGVGRFAVQLAALAGARVSGVSSSPERSRGLRGLGAENVMTTVDRADGGFDLILESAGGPSLGGAIGKLAPGGTIVALGNSSGEKHPFDFYDFMHLAPRGARIEVFFWTSDARKIGEDLGALVSLVAAKKLVSVMGWEGSWHEAASGMEALRERRTAGKVILLVD